ncbi:alpha/beta fold hydrolase [Brevundimonas sp. 2R-24]|uniref:Alpha/beta fold hydrolase n=1 Tax=Peiella sedimenti TaxID=3061083 RepID=A0ABT8SI51_9CAUL|nr:alpha/beta fold hydrolase [Caulobacteraceae bacterium XZ-24]
MIIALLSAMTLSATPSPCAPDCPAPDPGPSHSTEVELTDANGLKGTSAGAADTRAYAVIIPGSGPTNRDGDSPLGIRAATYRLLAEALAAQGIGTLRYDKRGVGGSAAAAVREEDLTWDVSVNDALAWIDWQRAQTRRPCVWVIGHSEGAQIALSAARRAPDKVCGLVLISGAGRPAVELLREQFASVPEPAQTQLNELMAELAADRPVECPPAFATLCRPSVQPYMRSWLALDPAADVAQLEVPILVVQGTTDLQTSVADAQRLTAAREGIELRLFEGVNHVLKVAPAERTANLATYSNPDLPLAPGLAEAVGEFILRARY